MRMLAVFRSSFLALWKSPVLSMVEGVRLRAIAALVVMLALDSPAGAFVCLKAGNGSCLHWAQGQATLTSFLGAPSTGALLNGTLSWDQNSINAANDWNAVGAAFHFNVQVGGQLIEPCGGPPGNNPVVFRPDVCGKAFGPDIIELTLNSWDASGAMINAPVFVNSSVPWNAYDGQILFSGSTAINDIRRVLLHEFGHVLGLDHPDLNGQTVQAIMNSQESDIDRLQPDDIAGIRSIYPGGAPPGAVSGCRLAPGGGSGVWLLVLPALLLLRRRRETKSRVLSREPGTSAVAGRSLPLVRLGPR